MSILPHRGQENYRIGHPEQSDNQLLILRSKRTIKALTAKHKWQSLHELQKPIHKI